AAQTDFGSAPVKVLRTMVADRRIIESDRRRAAKASLGDSLEQLWRIIDSRRNADPDTSYTAKLLMRGRRKAAQKRGEEAVDAVRRHIRPPGHKRQFKTEMRKTVLHSAGQRCPFRCGRCRLDRLRVAPNQLAPRCRG